MMPAEIRKVRGPSDDEVEFKRHLAAGWQKAWAVQDSERLVHPGTPHVLVCRVGEAESDGSVWFEVRHIGKDLKWPAPIHAAIYFGGAWEERADPLRAGVVLIEARWPPDPWQYVEHRDGPDGYLQMRLRPNP